MPTRRSWDVSLARQRYNRFAEGTKGKGHLLADQKYVHGAEVEVVEIGHGRHSLATRMHAGIKLCSSQHKPAMTSIGPYHDSLALVL